MRLHCDRQQRLTWYMAWSLALTELLPLRTLMSQWGSSSGAALFHCFCLHLQWRSLVVHRFSCYREWKSKLTGVFVDVALWRMRPDAIWKYPPNVANEPSGFKIDVNEPDLDGSLNASFDLQPIFRLMVPYLSAAPLPIMKKPCAAVAISGCSGCSPGHQAHTQNTFM